MNCDQVQKHLSEYLDKRLDEAKRLAIDDHLADCPLCLSETKRLSDGIKRVAALPKIEPPAGFSQQVMARIRKEAQPTLWETLFQPLQIKLPLHATALLLVVGLAVYLYQADEPIQKEIALSGPSESTPPVPQSAPAEPKSIDPQREASAPASSPPASPPPAQQLEERETRTQEAGRPEVSDRSGRTMAAQARGELKESKSETSAAAGAPLMDSGAAEPADAPSKKAIPPAPDIVLTLISKASFDEKGAISARVQEIVERHGGTLLPAAEKDAKQETDPHFRLDLPKSKYRRFKTELAQIGEVVSESRRSPDFPRKPTASTMEIGLTFLPEKPKESGPPPPSRPR